MEDKGKFLSIKNWDKYQIKMNHPRAKLPFIKSWVDKDQDPEFSTLTCFQRYILEGCQRLRARFGRNLLNSPTWIASALCVIPTERAHVSRAISTLTARGFLLLSNQQDDFLENSQNENMPTRGERKRKINGEKEKGEGDRNEGMLTVENESEEKPKAPPNKLHAVIVGENPKKNEIQPCARTVIEVLSLPKLHETSRFVEAGIEAEVSYRGCSPEDAAQRITQKAQEDRRGGMAIDKWYFVDTKWRGGNGKKSKSDAYSERIAREFEILERMQARTASA